MIIESKVTQSLDQTRISITAHHHVP